MPYIDPAKRKAYIKKWCDDHRERRRLDRKNRQRERVKQYVEYKRGLKCKYCAEKEIICLEFHHLDPSKKDHAASLWQFARDYSFKRFMREVEKCEVVCSNCHRKVHAGLLGD